MPPAKPKPNTRAAAKKKAARGAASAPIPQNPGSESASAKIENHTSNVGKSVSPAAFLEDNLFPGANTSISEIAEGPNTPAARAPPEDDLRTPTNNPEMGIAHSPIVPDQGTGLDGYTPSTPMRQSTPGTTGERNPTAATAPPGAPFKPIDAPFLPNEEDISDPSLPLKRPRANSSPSPNDTRQAQRKKEAKTRPNTEGKLTLATVGVANHPGSHSAVRTTSKDDESPTDTDEDNTGGAEGNERTRPPSRTPSGYPPQAPLALPPARPEQGSAPAAAPEMPLTHPSEQPGGTLPHQQGMYLAPPHPQPQAIPASPYHLPQIQASANAHHAFYPPPHLLPPPYGPTTPAQQAHHGPPYGMQLPQGLPLMWYDPSTGSLIYPPGVYPQNGPPQFAPGTHNVQLPMWPTQGALPHPHTLTPTPSAPAPVSEAQLNTTNWKDERQASDRHELAPRPLPHPPAQRESCLKDVSAAQRVEQLNELGIPIARAPLNGFPPRQMLDPADYLRGVSDSAKTKYLNEKPEKRVVLQVPGQLTNEEVEKEIEALNFAMAVIGSENEFEINGPRIFGPRIEGIDYPMTFLATGLSEDLARVLVELRAWSTPWTSFFVERTHETVPNFILRLSGFNHNYDNSIEADIFQMMLSPPLLGKLAKAISKNAYVGPEEMQDARDFIENKVEIRTTGAKGSREKVTASIYTTEPPSEIMYKWRPWKAEMRAHPYKFDWNAPASVDEDEHCKECQGVDHDDTACKYPDIPGWNALGFKRTPPGELPATAKMANQVPPPAYMERDESQQPRNRRDPNLAPEHAKGKEPAPRTEGRRGPSMDARDRQTDYGNQPSNAHNPREERGTRDPRDIRNVRETRSAYDSYDQRDPYDAHGTRDPRGTRDTRDARSTHEQWDSRAPRTGYSKYDTRDGREERSEREQRGPRDTRGAYDIRHSLDARDNRDNRDARDGWDAYGPRDSRDSNDDTARDGRDARDHRDAKDRRDARGGPYMPRHVSGDSGRSARDDDRERETGKRTASGKTYRQ
ncbi:hypothetical protein C8Q70DRAFT_1049583 [Cubamyces menziesii]|nr:hypothetical protein C8Q70DRAFT_1049583 [Cubamyces menziesii]